MRRVIVGTAGHIDHGKTKLVEALTGIDCDRWAEEKERGITIDLGFAYLREGDLQIGFIDVPGHERFVHNALAGLGGIRLVLLVVAADEGVKPQTREHLAICHLLRIPACLVALTKIDLVNAEVLELAQLEVEELLSITRFKSAPTVAVSSRTGDGLPRLRERLVELARRHHVVVDASLPARVPVDRAFHLKGLGVVVTGTLVSGTVAPGDTLELLPAGRKARVRGLQVHGDSRELAEAGERTALQLSGVSLDELRRGVQLVAGGRFRASRSLLARFELLPDAPKALKGSTPARFHLLSSEQTARIRPLQGPLAPGQSAIVELRLARPVIAVRGDHFIVRRPSPAVTLGGGQVLDPDWRPRRGRRLQQAVEALSADEAAALGFWVRDAQERGVDAPTLASRLGSDPEAVDSRLAELASEQQVLRVPASAGRGDRWLAPAAFRDVARRAERVLKQYFRRERLASGMRKAELIDRILPQRARDLADTYLGWLQAEKILVLDGDQVNLCGRSAKLTREESRLAADIVAQFEAAALQPPSPTQVQERLRAKRQIFDGVVKYLLQQGRLARLPGGLLISAGALDRLIDELGRSERQQFSVGDFKASFDLTRKWAIPILEHLDSVGVTRRIGDRRQVIRRGR